MAGSIIPAVLITGINSDSPAPVIAQVAENVNDSATGASILIPQGSKLLGQTSGATTVGQSRISIAWDRIIFPNTASMDLPKMPGTDAQGQGGFSDQVNNHYLRTFGLAALTSLISTGQMVGSNMAFGSGGGYPFTGAYNSNPNSLMLQEGAGAFAANMGGAAQQFANRGMNQPPTIEIRPGYQFNVIVTKDLSFPGPYNDGSVNNDGSQAG